MSTRQKVITLATTHPDLIQAEIARRVQVSRERVRQILLEEGVERKYRQCIDCGRILVPGYNCYNSRQCPDCQRRRYEKFWEKYRCCYCGKWFSALRSDKDRHELHFCSRTCHGKWLGAKYGFGVHPKHRGLEKRKRRKQMLKYEVVDTNQIPRKARHELEADELISKPQKG